MFADLLPYITSILGIVLSVLKIYQIILPKLQPFIASVASFILRIFKEESKDESKTSKNIGAVMKVSGAIVSVILVAALILQVTWVNIRRVQERAIIAELQVRFDQVIAQVNDLKAENTRLLKIMYSDVERSLKSK